jgi:hypothetical protein
MDEMQRPARSPGQCNRALERSIGAGAAVIGHEDRAVRLKPPSAFDYGLAARFTASSTPGGSAASELLLAVLVVVDDHQESL